MNTSTDDFIVLFFLSGMVYWWYLLFVVTKSLVDKKKCAKTWVYKQRYSYCAFSNNIICSQNASNDVTGTILIILRLVFVFRYDRHQVWVPFLELCHHILETFL